MAQFVADYSPSFDCLSKKPVAKSLSRVNDSSGSGLCHVLAKEVAVNSCFAVVVVVVAAAAAAVLLVCLRFCQKAIAFEAERSTMKKKRSVMMSVVAFAFLCCCCCGLN